MSGALLISVDMDDLWCFEEQSRRKDSKESILKEATIKSLEFFSEHSIKATFFCIARDCAILKDIIPDIVKSGHEIANHSFHHRDNRTLSKAQKYDDIIHSTEILEEISGRKILGYRAPSWGCDEDVLEILQQAGYRYDASMAISPLFIFLRQYHAYAIGAKSYIYGNAMQNFGIKPKCRLRLIPMPSVLQFPFYGSFHLYAPLGMQLFRLQKRFVPETTSYVLHAVDFVEIDSAVKALKKTRNHNNYLSEIVTSLQHKRRSKSILEHVDSL